MSPQATKLRRVLRVHLGNTRQRVRVRTSTKTLRDPHDGLRYREYGSASCSVLKHVPGLDLDALARDLCGTVFEILPSGIWWASTDYVAAGRVVRIDTSKEK